MKIGAIYPQIELGGAPEPIGQIGRAVEQMGLDHLVMYDHVVGAVHKGREPALTGPYTQNDPFHDPFVAFGYLAAITQRIELVTGVLILPQRQTVLVAKQATDVDLLSNGRLTLGVGIGWNYVEYDALGQDFHARGKRLDEQIPYLRRLWGEEEIEWQGRFDGIDRANLVPRPKRQIPIFCGGFSGAAYKRAAHLADGFIFVARNMGSTIEEWEQIRALLRETGRDPAGFGGHALIANEAFGAPSPQDTADLIRRWQDAGGTHASILSMGLGFTEAAQHVDHFAAVKALL